jgi:hypothetical protein
MIFVIEHAQEGVWRVLIGLMYRGESAIYVALSKYCWKAVAL